MCGIQADHPRLGQLAAELGLHEHLCLIYDTQEEQLAAAVPYLRAGLERGEKCLYVADENSAGTVLDALRSAGTDVERCLRSGALTVTGKQEAYLKTGRFDPDSMIRFWTDAVNEAWVAKFSGLRTLVSEMTWALGDSPGAEGLMAYESKLNHFVRDHNVVLVCQYNRARFPPEIISGVLRTHPLVVCGGLVAKNPYYVPPEEFLKPNQPALEVDRLLKNILEWQRAKEAQRQSEERFRTLFEAVQVGVVVSGPKAEVLMCNQAALDLLGVTQDELLGTTPYDPKWKTVHEDGSPWPAETHPIPEVIATGRRIRNSLLGLYRPVLHDLVWLLVSAEAQFGPDGEVSRVVCAFEDITERKRAEDELRRQKEILQKIFDNVPAMISFTGADGRIRLLNREWERTIGWTLEEIRERNVDVFAETYPDPQDRQRVLEFVARASGEFEDFKTRIRDGRVIDTSWARVRLSDGTTIGIGRDITERKWVEERLRQRESDFAMTQKVAKIGTWRLHIATDTVTWSEGLCRIFEVEEATFNGSYESFLNRVHPNDRMRVAEVSQKARTGGDSFDLDYRIVRPAGGYKHIREIAYAMKDATGAIVGLFGTAQDVTESKLAEEELQHSRNQLRALAGRLQHIREEERTKVAREIHDQLGQALTGIKLDLSSLARELPAEKKSRTEAVLALVDGTIQSVRRISTELRPAILDAVGLVAAIEWAAEEFDTRTGIRCRLDLPQDDLVTNQDCATALFRIFQETLTNVVRHANASEVSVQLISENNSLTLEVHDNGMGISEEQLPTDSSLGILGMRERALLLGGEFTISGAPGKGTTVRVQIPEARWKPPEEGT